MNQAHIFNKSRGIHVSIILHLFLLYPDHQTVRLFFLFFAYLSVVCKFICLSAICHNFYQNYFLIKLSTFIVNPRPLHNAWCILFAWEGDGFNYLPPPVRLLVRMAIELNTPQKHNILIFIYRLQGETFLHFFG